MVLDPNLFEVPMKPAYSFISIMAAVLLLTAACCGQASPGKKSYKFHGKVEAVDESGKTLKVNGEEVKGWMAAMTMDYKVDDAAVLTKVKRGDVIIATVYDGDYVLHKVEVMPKQSSEPKSKK
jgi:Cu/Ag efflux protein CusF